MKYTGDIQRLRQAIAGSGIKVEIETKDNLTILRTSTGAVCTWVPSNGTLTIQGKPAAQEQLAAVIQKFLDREAKKHASGLTSVAPTKRKRNKRRVFVVHGHDHVSRDQLSLVLHELGLNPYVLARSETSGLTIIEALERQITPSPGGAGFGIVLLTPEDVGHAVRDGGTGTRRRARQNVILEFGMLLGALGRKNVAVLKTGPVEMPSDLGGLLLMEYRENVREVVPRLCQRLRDAGFEISADAMSRASM